MGYRDELRLLWLCGSDGAAGSHSAGLSVCGLTPGATRILRLPWRGERVRVVDISERRRSVSCPPLTTPPSLARSRPSNRSSETTILAGRCAPKPCPRQWTSRCARRQRRLVSSWSSCASRRTTPTPDSSTRVQGHARSALELGCGWDAGDQRRRHGPLPVAVGPRQQ